MFEIDMTNVQESGDFTPIPAGKYTLRLGEKEVLKSAKGHNQVKLELIVDEGDFNGRKIWHYVTFLPPDNNGAGIAKHWLHAIGEEFEGKITVNPQQWNGIVLCDVKIEEYKKRDGTIGKSNKIADVYLPDSKTKTLNTRDKSGISEDIPF